MSECQAMTDYAAECDLPCKCGKPDWIDGGVDDSGSAVNLEVMGSQYWFDGWAVCKCGSRIEFSDTSC